MTAYDENVLQQHAERYPSGSWIVWWTAIRFACVGLLVALVLSALFSAYGPQLGIKGDVSGNVPFVILVGGVVGAIIGIGAGKRKSFRLRLQAQQLLCQRQIELNTRAIT